MRRSFEAAILGIAVIAMIACGGKQSVASKSAQAYREAIAQGKKVSGGGHGGHHAESSETAPGNNTKTNTGMTAMPHASMAGMDQSQMNHGTSTGRMAGMSHGAAGMNMNHSNMQHGTAGSTSNMTAMQHGSMAGMNHSAMAHGSMAGMNHGAMQHASGSSMPGMNMDHSKMQHGSTHDMQNMPGMSHGAMADMQHGGGAIPAGGLWGAQPGSLKQSDAVDAPAASSIHEAQKSAADDMSGMNHGVQNTTSSHGGHMTSTNTSDVKQQAMYTCPMHPEVVSSTPGTCPKCGMLLVRKGSQ